MELTEIIKNKTVFVDTTPLIYYIEDSNNQILSKCGV